MTNTEKERSIQELDEEINTLLKQCNNLWLKIYNQLTGNNCELHDIGFINDYSKDNLEPKYHEVMDTLSDTWILLIKSGISFEDEPIEMKLDTIKALEDMLDKLKIFDRRLNY